MNCQQCGVKFSGRRNKKHCSPECKQRGQAQRRRLERRKPDLSLAILGSLALAGTGNRSGKWRLRCQGCGKEFWSRHEKRKSCSPACRRKGMATKRRRAYVRKTRRVECLICGRAFMGRPHAKTCSEDCRRIYHRRTDRRRKNVRAACLACGRDMSDLPSLPIYRYTCSPECRREALRRKQRRAYAKRAG